MVVNYVKIALRSLRKNRLFTWLNTMGLATGLAVSAYLFMLVGHERSFDGFYPKKERICRVVLDQKSENNSGGETMPIVPNIVAPASREGIAAVKTAARILSNNFTGQANVSAAGKQFLVEKLVWADPALVDIFDLKAAGGDLEAALREPNSIALSRTEARRFFGQSEAVGQYIQVDRRDPLLVRAVFEDFPENSTLDARLIGSFVTEKWANDPLVWSNASFETWLLLDKASDRPVAEAMLNDLYRKATPPEERGFSMWLQPLEAVHFGSATMSDNVSSRIGDPRQVALLSILALAVLLMACFNYMNLSTANAQARAREVGVSKVVGASKSHLMLRFYAETAVLTTLSLLIAVGMVWAGLPFFNELADRRLAFSSFLTPSNLMLLSGIGVAVVLLAGSYPALMLSSFLPKNLLNKGASTPQKGGWMRRGLVIAQFAASFTLLVVTICIWRQMQFIQQKDLGFRPEQVLAVSTTAAEKREQIDGLMNDCRSLAAVKELCRTQSIPGMTTSRRSIFLHENDNEGLTLYTCRATRGVESTLGLTFLAGAGLPEKLPGDTTVHVVLSKKAVDYLGLSPAEAIGKRVDCQLGPNAYVVGVVGDFHTVSLHQALEAYAFHDFESEQRQFMLVKLSAANLPAAVAQVEAAFKRHFPAAPFDVRFVDQSMEKLYQADRRMARVTMVFSLLAIFVSCLGLFGLAAFAAAKRSKEIGIRKVLGASLASLNALLARDFLTLVLLGIAAALPLAFYLMQEWLSDFAYRIDIEWWFFAAAGLAVLAAAFLTVGFQSIRASLVNPVQSLRNE